MLALNANAVWIDPLHTISPPRLTSRTLLHNFIGPLRYLISSSFPDQMALKYIQNKLIASVLKTNCLHFYANCIEIIYISAPFISTRSLNFINFISKMPAMGLEVTRCQVYWAWMPPELSALCHLGVHVHALLGRTSHSHCLCSCWSLNGVNEGPT